MLPRLGIDLVLLRSELVTNVDADDTTLRNLEHLYTGNLREVLYYAFVFPYGVGDTLPYVNLSPAPGLSCLSLPTFGVNVMKHSPSLLVIKGIFLLMVSG